MKTRANSGAWLLTLAIALATAAAITVSILTGLPI